MYVTFLTAQVRSANGCEGDKSLVESVIPHPVICHITTGLTFSLHAKPGTTLRHFLVRAIHFEAEACHFQSEMTRELT